MLSASSGSATSAPVVPVVPAPGAGVTAPSATTGARALVRRIGSMLK
jgi:hypothetical protein